MITTILLDLDETILQTNLELLIPTYARELAQALAGDEVLESALDAVLFSFREATTESAPLLTVRERFYQALATEMDRSRAELESVVDAYVRDGFPILRPITRPIPDVPAWMRSLFDVGLEVAIATNPIFPAAATEERLGWAGVPASEYPYGLISTYENAHFTKPDPAYYAELLGRLGRTPDEAAMVGDDIRADLAPARSLGMAVYHAAVEPDRAYPGGELTGVLDWLESDAPTEVNEDLQHEPPALLAILRGQIGAMLGMAEGLEPDEWTRRPVPEAWAPLEILMHLLDTEREVNQVRVQKVLGKDYPFLPAKETDHWAEERVYIREDPEAARNAWLTTRLETVAAVEALTSEQWGRQGQHALLGPTRLSELVSIGVQHELLHLAQMRATIAQILTE